MDFMDFDKRKPSSEKVQGLVRDSVRETPSTLKTLSELHYFVTGTVKNAFLDDLLV